MPSVCDPSLFIKVTSHTTTYILVYVDDILITSKYPTFINSFKARSLQSFSLKGLGVLHYFLGIEVSYVENGDIHLCQKKYIQDLLARAHMDKAEPLNTSMTTNLMLTKQGHNLMSNSTLYKSIVGALQYVTIIKPEIAILLTKFVSSCKIHWMNIREL